jgi:hypothetical protein
MVIAIAHSHLSLCFVQLGKYASFVRIYGICYDFNHCGLWHIRDKELECSSWPLGPSRRL